MFPWLPESVRLDQDLPLDRNISRFASQDNRPVYARQRDPDFASQPPSAENRVDAESLDRLVGLLIRKLDRRHGLARDAVITSL
jgi:hypothetical protein